MYPVLFRIGTFEVTSFGVLVATAALLGLWLFRRELRLSDLPESAIDSGVAGLIGGLAGAKLLWVAEHLGEEPLGDLVFSRGGMSWFGGLAGGVLAGTFIIYRRRLSFVRVLSAAAPALALGHMVGRIGCFLVGDDYGRTTDLPWGVAFPEGLPPTVVPVHPTQLYEAAALLPVVWLLLGLRRRDVADGIVLGVYLTLTGVIRFAIEFIRINQRVVGPLSVAHIGSIAVMLVGFALIMRTPSAGLSSQTPPTGIPGSSRYRESYGARSKKR